jgi:hypothetical protein
LSRFAPSSLPSRTTAEWQSNGFAAWAQRLVDEGLAEVSTYFRKRGETLLLPRLLPERVGLVSLWQWTDDSAFISVWRSVFERRAPTSIERVESLRAPTPLGKGNSVSDVSDDLLAPGTRSTSRPTLHEQGA